MQDFLLECKIWANSATAIKYAESFSEDNSKQINKLKKTIPIIEKLVTDKPNPAKLPELLQMIDNIKVVQHELKVWAARFGIAQNKKQRVSKTS